VKRVERLSEDDLESYLEWWQLAVAPRITRAVGILPVDPEIYEMAERAGLVEQYRLVSVRERP